MFNSKEKIADIGKTLWSLSETIGELRGSCEQLAKAVEKQEERIRILESEAISLKADIRISSAESREAAGDKATSVASNLVGNSNSEIFSRLNELQAKLDALVDIEYPKNSNHEPVLSKNPEVPLKLSSK